MRWNNLVKPIFENSINKGVALENADSVSLFNHTEINKNIDFLFGLHQLELGSKLHSSFSDFSKYLTEIKKYVEPNAKENQTSLSEIRKSQLSNVLSQWKEMQQRQIGRRTERVTITIFDKLEQLYQDYRLKIATLTVINANLEKLQSVTTQLDDNSQIQLKELKRSKNDYEKKISEERQALMELVYDLIKKLDGPIHGIDEEGKKIDINTMKDSYLRMHQNSIFSKNTIKGKYTPEVEKLINLQKLLASFLKELTSYRVATPVPPEETPTEETPTIRA